MNLTKDQRNALSQKLAREINEENKKNFVPNKSATSIVEDVINPEVRKISNLIDKLNQKIKKLEIYSNGGFLRLRGVDEFLTSSQSGYKYTVGEQKGAKYISPEIIKEELILGEIDTPDLKQLIKKIKDKFK